MILWRTVTGRYATTAKMEVFIISDKLDYAD
jgi:hypothetical protein